MVFDVTIISNPIFLTGVLILLVAFLWTVLIPSKKMATKDMQRTQSQREALETDYHYWMLQTDVYFDAGEYASAYGAANMAAAKLKQLSELNAEGQ